MVYLIYGVYNALSCTFDSVSGILLLNDEPYSFNSLSDAAQYVERFWGRLEICATTKA